MGRIRTIKPEFPQSESVGRLSRDARLLFLQLFTIVDDDGRCRGASRFLASTLYPYDDDAPKLLDGWLTELESCGMVRRYTGDDGNAYLDIPKWKEHQKIDHAKESKLPAFREAVATIRDDSRKLALDRTRDQGSGIKDQGSGPAAPDAAAAAPSAEAPAATVANVILAEWNMLGPPFAQARSTPDRRKAIKSRMADAWWAEHWSDGLARIRGSPFCRGETPESTWVADIDWFLKPQSLTKIIEGKYDQRTNGHRHKSTAHAREAANADAFATLRAAAASGRGEEPG